MSMDFVKSIYYEIKSYFVPEKLKYPIEGKCLKCGNCCRQIRCYGLKNERELKFMQFIFPHYKRFYINGTDENGDIILTCKFLSEEGKCNVYKKRPKVCRDYPKKIISINAQMLDGCGYRVMKKEFKDYFKSP